MQLESDIDPVLCRYYVTIRSQTPPNQLLGCLVLHQFFDKEECFD